MLGLKKKTREKRETNCIIRWCRHHSLIKLIASRDCTIKTIVKGSASQRSISKLSILSTGMTINCVGVRTKQVRASIEEHRLLLGLTRDQVLISTDMYGSTSGTYSAKVSCQTQPKVKGGGGGAALRNTPMFWRKQMQIPGGGRGGEAFNCMSIDRFRSTQLRSCM